MMAYQQQIAHRLLATSATEIDFVGEQLEPLVELLQKEMNAQLANGLNQEQSQSGANQPLDRATAAIFSHKSLQQAVEAVSEREACSRQVLSSEQFVGAKRVVFFRLPAVLNKQQWNSADFLLGHVARMWPHYAMVEQRTLQQAGNDAPLALDMNAQADVTSPALQRARFYAHGFNYLATAGQHSWCFQLFGFQLSTYKAVPQWLNSRYWANPEQFNQRN